VAHWAYFATYGDEEGRKLQQRHVDLLNQVLPAGQGRIVDTAGDGAFLCFPAVEGAAESLITLDKLVTADNAPRPRKQHLRLRIGLHWGRVLTDGDKVTGDAVNLTSRVAGTARAGELRLTREAFHELSTNMRILCTPQPPVEVKGVSRPIELMVMDWRDPFLFPDRVAIQETREELELPHLDTIAFGRLKDAEGTQANDVALIHPDPQKAMKVSRWHFELRRQADGFVLHQISEAPTEVDGESVGKGGRVRVRQNTVVKVGGVITLVFKGRPAKKSAETTSYSDT
jgi:hypothetical protein